VQVVLQLHSACSSVEFQIRLENQLLRQSEFWSQLSHMSVSKRRLSTPGFPYTGHCTPAFWFPYTRTLIICDPSGTTASKDSSSWSGSANCHDKDLVARKAQSLLGMAIGLNSICQFATIADMGAAADAFGRKRIVLLYFAGVSPLSISSGLRMHCQATRLSDHIPYTVVYNLSPSMLLLSSKLGSQLLAEYASISYNS